MLWLRRKSNAFVSPGQVPRLAEALTNRHGLVTPRRCGPSLVGQGTRGLADGDGAAKLFEIPPGLRVAGVARQRGNRVEQAESRSVPVAEESVHELGKELLVPSRG